MEGSNVKGVRSIGGWPWGLSDSMRIAKDWYIISRRRRKKVEECEDGDVGVGGVRRLCGGCAGDGHGYGHGYMLVYIYVDLPQRSCVAWVVVPGWEIVTHS